MRDFKLTETICDQAVLVSAELHGWSEWFTNATAGPWKKIDVPGVSSSYATGFGKTEERPDLILYNDKPDKKILIIESKNDIEKLLAPSQIPKSCKVFSDMKTKLDELCKSSKNKSISNNTKSINYIPGYVVGHTTDLIQKLPELEKLHFKHVDKSFPHFLLIVVIKSNYDLFIQPHIFSSKPNKKSLELQKFFQTEI